MSKRPRFPEVKDKVDTEPPALEPALGLTLFVEAVEPQKNGKNRKKPKKKSKIKLATGLAVLAFVFLWGFHLKAQTLPGLPPSVPHLINFQSVLTDIGGVPLADGFHNVQFRLLNIEKEPIYTETQNLESVGGVVSAMIGAQDDMGMDKFAPDQAKFLGVKGEGSAPETLLEIVSVPYSIYAEQALTVADTVTQNILSMITPEVLPQSVVYADQLSSPTASANIGITTNNFTYSIGSNVQGVLKDLDTAISIVKSDLQGQIAAGDAALQNQIVAGDTATKTYVDTKITETRAYIDSKTAVDPSGNVYTPPSEIKASGIVKVSGSASLSSGYNVSGASGGNSVTVQFSSSVSPPYIVLVTPIDSASNTNGLLYVHDMTSSSFVVDHTWQGFSIPVASFNFVVFK